MEKNVGRKTKWSSLKKTLEDEERYKAVEGSSNREAIFREYQETLSEETISVCWCFRFSSVFSHSCVFCFAFSLGELNFFLRIGFNFSLVKGGWKPSDGLITGRTRHFF